MGDAKSLLGGTLARARTLIGADGEVYAVSQGTVQTGAVSASGAFWLLLMTRGVPTVRPDRRRRRSIERELGFELRLKLGQMRLTLRNPDFTTAERVAQAINASATPAPLPPTTPTIVTVKPPEGRPDWWISSPPSSRCEVEPDTPAKVVIDEVSGIVVMGD